MLNPIYHFEKMREVLNEFEPSRELSLAKTKLEECELWDFDGQVHRCGGPDNCAVCAFETITAQQAAIANGTSINTIRESLGFPPLPVPQETYDEETMVKVFGALTDLGMPGDEVMNCIKALQNAGILFRERK
jgi:hypothetical protein